MAWHISSLSLTILYFLPKLLFVFVGPYNSEIQIVYLDLHLPQLSLGSTLIMRL